ncbi:bifunctional 3,4-dihydroxy-2-butanone-4-phosphate synthase/GTP cyclohydrolase II [Actinocorallia sp. API 0066]|uniref:bifunctional 3,4-dihydroxy-2-butanone-4-phosphate synthase/GTP cyclohydrolase II n=1 Tax=Actinocorallia sp. API 0066 TaxID=2896846 RepID=UPI001E3A6E2D|nr:bifunctional 3,4-dihydroxy-2-butanone-4-phosphate synthase/GTP cyclohydrolase II [Actinocorallia sp. API 0066]MCD0450904.1 bifunctional 3,4-dihydroxy-2-butanone-4-phosphate synthase/GTP cyclohydrolase II [Actinocorallia sp. API 0066]
MTTFNTIEEALADIALGRPVVVVDDEDRENEGDLIFAAEKATPEVMAFMIRYTSGYVCVALPESDCVRLDLPPMHHTNQDARGTAYTVTVDAAEGVSTGISAADRARTTRLLASADTVPSDLRRPGHVVPLRAREHGVLARRGHTEATVDLARLAGLRPAGALCEIVNDDGTMARLPQLEIFAKEHDLKLISIEQLVEYRKRTESLVVRAAETVIPNRFGTWRAVGFASSVDGGEHIALVLGDLGDGTDVLTRVHSECLTGDVLHSDRCDCGTQLDAAMAEISAQGRGVVVYLRGQEGRGIGLIAKLRAYALQDGGVDTVDANLELGHPVDARDYTNAAHILADLGVSSVRLLTNNPDKVAALHRFGLDVTGRAALPVHVTEHNLRYLTVKRDRLGHQIEGLA